MSTTCSNWPCFSPRTARGWFGRALRLFALAGLCLGHAWAISPERYDHPEYLIDNWQASEGIPEHSAFCIAQTPDGYLWVGSYGGMLRYNGNDFTPIGPRTGFQRLSGLVSCLYADRTGRLWTSGRGGMAVHNRGGWERIEGLPGTNLIARTFACDPTGQVYVGTMEGGLLVVKSNRLEWAPSPPRLSPSGVFCLADRMDGRLWLANRFFIGRLTPEGWKATGPQLNARESLIATAAREGGLWVYCHSRLRHYQTNGIADEFPAPDVDQPRELLEDRAGNIWIASNLRGLFRMKPGLPPIQITTTNGLANNAVSGLAEDSEGNIWVGTSSGGLHRLRPRHFVNYGIRQGLPDQIVRTVIEEAPGRMLVGTHGGGTARIENGVVKPAHRLAGSARGAFVWTVLKDRSGKVWLGTYSDGLFYEADGMAQPYMDWPAGLSQTINSLFEDSQGRIWVGTSSGLGLITNGKAQVWQSGTNAPLAGVNVRAIAEDPRSGDIWLGSYNRGLFHLGKDTITRWGAPDRLASDRISCVAFDQDGCLWVGIFGHGLACLRDGRITTIDRTRGLPADTIGSVFEDKPNWFWFGSDHGILRLSGKELHQVLQQPGTSAQFNVFDRTDGMGSAECAEGFQPAAARDHEGRLWFATLKGVVSVNPRTLRLSTNAPPVVVESLSYLDSAGATHQLNEPASTHLSLPAGISDLTFNYAALTYTEPEKVVFAWSLEGARRTWTGTGQERFERFHTLAPGNYRLRVRAQNSDGGWNDTGATIPFSIAPYVWQTWWFRLLSYSSLTAGVCFAGWRLARGQLRRQFERLEQQRDRIRLAAVMDGTTDLVVFADHSGSILHVNPAGRRLLGFEPEESLLNRKLSELHPKTQGDQIETVAIPAARKSGSWEGETLLLHRDGRTIPASQVIIAHADDSGSIRFLSTIARDISERKKAEEEKDRLQDQLAQAQKMESVGRLAGGVAHDFNNMLQVILGHAAMALEQVSGDDQLRSHLADIQRSALRSAELTGQLLAFARKQPVSPRVLDLNQTVTGLLKMLQRLISENIHLQWTPGKNLWHVKIDPIQIDQILVNLAVNARDAIVGNGTLIIETANASLVNARLDGQPEPVTGDYVSLTVSDTGGGMTQEVRQHLFEPFFTTKEFGKGTGLGLAMIFGIVKQNKGFITVTSEPGQGTQFKIYLPCTDAVPTSAPVAPPPRSRLLAGGTVLLVEDEPQILHLVTRVLRLNGCNVLATAHPEQALLIAEKHPGKIHLLVTDVVMPGMNGRELRQQLQARQPDLKCLYMSGYTADVIAHHGALEEGVQFLQKPFTVTAFIEKVATLLSDESKS